MQAHDFSRSYTSGSCTAAARASVCLYSLLDTALLLAVSICVISLVILGGCA